VGLVVSEFTATRVTYTVGMGYTAGHHAVNDGDLVEFHVNGASAAVVVHYGQVAQNQAVCTVPRVVGLQLGPATAALRKARCELGKTTKPKKPLKRKLVVKVQRPAAGALVTAGTRVSLMLG